MGSLEVLLLDRKTTEISFVHCDVVELEGILWM